MNQMIAELEALDKWARSAIALAKEERKQQESRLLEKKRRLKEDCRRQAEVELKAWKDELLKRMTKEEEQEKEKILEETRTRLLWFEEKKETLAAQLVREIAGLPDSGELS